MVTLIQLLQLAARRAGSTTPGVRKPPQSDFDSTITPKLIHGLIYLGYTTYK